MVGCHHRFNGHELEQTPGDGEGRGSLVCCNSWGRKESDMTEQLNLTEECFRVAALNHTASGTLIRR